VARRRFLVPAPNNPGRHRSLAAGKSPILCYVTDRKSLPVASPGEATSALLQKMATLAAAGVDWIQIREKDFSAKNLAELAREALRPTASDSRPNRRQPRILVNDRLDVALSEGAGGVHLGEQSLPVAEAIRLVDAQVAQSLLFTQGAEGPVPAKPVPKRPPPKDFLVGASAHSLESVKSAAQAGASYVIFGPIFATPSKTSFGEPQGLPLLADACRAVEIPVLAIGGITIENAAACIAAGAAGIAAIRLFQDAPDPAATIKVLRQLLA
jgi:thiamine-phosphate pyrophosphorylase